MDDSDGSGPGTTRRERRIAARREQILQAAAKVFTEKGFHGATTKDIAEAADVAEGTIYNYFENKDALLLALINSLAMLNQREQIMEAGLQQDMSRFFVEHFLDRLQIVSQDMDALAAILPELLARPELREPYFASVVTPAIAMLERHAQARIAHGEIRPLDVPLAVRAFVGMFLGLWMLVALGDPFVQEAWAKPDQVVEKLFDLIMDGIRAKGEES